VVVPRLHTFHLTRCVNFFLRKPTLRIEESKEPQLGQLGLNYLYGTLLRHVLGPNGTNDTIRGSYLETLKTSRYAAMVLVSLLATTWHQGVEILLFAIRLPIPKPSQMSR